MGKAFAQTCAIALNDGTGFQSATQPLGHLHPHSPTADPDRKRMVWMDKQVYSTSARLISHGPGSSRVHAHRCFKSDWRYTNSFTGTGFDATHGCNS